MTVCARATRTLVPLLVALGVLGEGGASAQGTPPATIEIQSCMDRCGLTSVVVSEYGDALGAGMIESEHSIGLLDPSGRNYVAAMDHVLVFAPEGNFLRRVGRRGEGPGEMLELSSVAIVDDGVFVVIDRGRGVIMKFDWTGTLLHEVRIRGWIPSGLALLPLGGDIAVYEANIRTADRIGYPLHLINLETGGIGTSFGSLTGEYDPDRERRLVITAARGSGDSIWVARLFAYWIELWDSDNRLLVSMRRDLDWFPDALVDRTGIHGRPALPREPEPTLMGVVADDSLLWVMVHRSDDRWKQASQYDDQKRVDTFIEVIDWKRGRVIASQRFDEVYYPWLGPGLVGQAVITTEGSLRMRISRIELEGDDDRAAATRRTAVDADPPKPRIQ